MLVWIIIDNTAVAFLDSNRVLRKRILYVCAAAAFLIWLQASGLQTVLDLRSAWQEEQRLGAEIEELKTRNADLEKDIDDLEHNGFRVEQIAREKMGLAKKDEFVVVVPGKK